MMVLWNKKYLLFGLLVFSAFVRPNQSIEITNASELAVEVEIGIAEKTKATVSFEKLPQEKDDDYIVVALPENFMVHRRSEYSAYTVAGLHVFNNAGQVAGYIYDRDQTPVIPNQKKQSGKLSSFDGKATIWDPKHGLILTGLHSSRCIAMDDAGNVAISRNQESSPGLMERHPNIFWNVTNRKFDFNPEYSVQNGKWILPNPALKYEYPYIIKDIQQRLHMWHLLDTSNLNISTRVLVSNHLDEKSAELLVYSKSGFSLVSFEYEFDVDSSKYRSWSPMLHARLNDLGEVVALLRDDNGKYLIGKWYYEGKTTVSETLQRNSAFKGYNSFDIVGFNTSGEILIFADTSESMHSRDYKPINPRLFLMVPVQNMKSK